MAVERVELWVAGRAAPGVAEGAELSGAEGVELWATERTQLTSMQAVVGAVETVGALKAGAPHLSAAASLPVPEQQARAVRVCTERVARV